MNISKTLCKCDCTFEKMLCFSPISIQGHFDQTPVRKDTEICYSKCKENRTDATIGPMLMEWAE
jgi:hypothetical protein